MKLLSLITTYLFDFIKANATIARQVLSPKIDVHPETIEIPTKVESDLEILALSNLITFTPGTLTVSIEPGETLQVHVLDDGKGAAEAIRTRLEEPLLAVTRKS